MLYQASRDGFGASVFHAKCDGVIGTLTIVRTMISYIIGGYTSADWSGYYSFKYDPSAFLFSLTNPFNIPFRSNVTQPSNAILSHFIIVRINSLIIIRIQVIIRPLLHTHMDIIIFKPLKLKSIH